MRTAFFCIILALFCQACNQQSTKSDVSTVNPEASAQQMIVTGDYLGAAEEYTRLAEIYPQRAVFYQLRTADALLKADDVRQAEDILKHVQASTDLDVLYKNILLARVALKNNQAQLALELLSMPPATQTPADFVASWHRARSQAYELSLNFLNAAEERIQLDSYLLDPVERRTNIKFIWEDLNHINLPILRELRGSAPESMRAWIELTIINQTMLFKSELLTQALNSWAEQYPNHAAIPTITEEIMALSHQAMLRPEHLALLLPLSGQYEKAGHAIRDGFLAAWYEEQGTRPKISIYDANALNIDNTYQQAINAGADLVIGPLEKKAIDALLKKEQLAVTTLALNHTDQGLPEHMRAGGNKIPRLIQFGLSPEDEARQAAEQAIFDGHNKALIITPDNDWGLRLAQAFTEVWVGLGGKVLEHVRYDDRQRDYSTPVKALLNLDSSLLRARKLQQKLNRNLQYEPRLRQDADMIFMAAVPLSARQIVPQFRFYLADGIPVYATSHAYSGIANQQADSDMNGIYFTDMPALLSPEKLSSAVHASINRAWSADTSSFRRLYALGIDAYRMIPYIGKLSLLDTAVYNGETGDLYMTDDGRIQRKLLWARFIDGNATLLDSGRQY